MSSITGGDRLSRRDLMRRMAIASGVVTLGPIAVACSAPGLGGGPTKITWMSNAGPYGEAVKRYVFEPFGKANNVEFEFIGGSTTEMLARARAEKDAPTVDFFGTGEGVAVTMRTEGLLEKMDASKVPNYKVVLDVARNDEGYPPMGGFISNVIYYNKEYVKEPITSWADLWRPDLKKKVAYPDIPNTTGLHMLLMASKIAANDTTKNTGERFVNDAAFKKMKELLPNTYNIYGIQSGFDGFAALRSGEVWAFVSGLYGQSNMLKEPNTPIKAAIQTREGIPNSPLTLGIVKGTKKSIDLLHKLIDHYLSKDAQIGIAREADVVPVTDIELPSDMKEVLPAPQAMLKTDWKYIAPQRPLWTERWNKEILAG